MRRLSQTQIRTYQTCPQRWKQRYVDGRKAEAESGNEGETS
jgi:hypothetical protein